MLVLLDLVSRLVLFSPPEPGTRWLEGGEDVCSPVNRFTYPLQTPATSDGVRGEKGVNKYAALHERNLITK